MRLPRLSRLTHFLLGVPVLAGIGAPVRAQSAADIAKVVSLMKADSYSFDTTKSPSVWVIHSAGVHLKDIQEVIAVGGGDDATLVVFVTVAEKRRLPSTTDFMRTLLEENHKMDRVKIGYDEDGDLELRADAMLRVTDAKEFQGIVNQVRNASDALYGMIESQLTP